jgi:hypothetical protein
MRASACGAKQPVAFLRLESSAGLCQALELGMGALPVRVRHPDERVECRVRAQIPLWRRPAFVTKPGPGTRLKPLLTNAELVEPPFDVLRIESLALHAQDARCVLELAFGARELRPLQFGQKDVFCRSHVHHGAPKLVPAASFELGNAERS